MIGAARFRVRQATLDAIAHSHRRSTDSFERLMIRAFLSIAVLGAMLAIPASAQPCADRYFTAAAVETPEGLEAFVHCAHEYVLEHGTAKARRAFHKDARWRHGPTYVFVSQLLPDGNDAVAFVNPPNPSREGQPFGPLLDRFGGDYFAERHRVLSSYGSGWVYYEITNPATGLTEPKASYQIAVDWDGVPAAIGAGIYRRDIPGTCDPSSVNATALALSPTNRVLKEFVRCAAMQVESLGQFAGPVFESHPRWNMGPFFVYLIEAETEEVKFSGNPLFFAISRRVGDALFGGRDALGIAEAMGEAFWYSLFTDPGSGQVVRQNSFVKRVLVDGVPMVVGSGYYLRPLEGSY